MAFHKRLVSDSYGFYAVYPLAQYYTVRRGLQHACFVITISKNHNLLYDAAVFLR